MYRITIDDHEAIGRRSELGSTFVSDGGCRRRARGERARAGRRAGRARADVSRAVLVGANTRNAAEDLAMAFRRRPRTRSFGAPSAGLPVSGAVVHGLSDGRLLGVLETRPVDRNGVVQRTPIEPDTVLEDERALLPQPVQE
jgi:hypothetical protein